MRDSRNNELVLFFKDATDLNVVGIDLLAGPTETLLHQTGKLTVEVNAGIGLLARTLMARGLTVVTDDPFDADGEGGAVDVVVGPDLGPVLDTIRDALADLGLPLHRLSSRAASLDEAFVASEQSAAGWQ